MTWLLILYAFAIIVNAAVGFLTLRLAKIHEADVAKLRRGRLVYFLAMTAVLITSFILVLTTSWSAAGTTP